MATHTHTCTHAKIRIVKKPFPRRRIDRERINENRYKAKRTTAAAATKCSIQMKWKRNICCAHNARTKMNVLALIKWIGVHAHCTFIVRIHSIEHLFVFHYLFCARFHTVQVHRPILYFVECTQRIVVPLWFFISTATDRCQCVANDKVILYFHAALATASKKNPRIIFNELNVPKPEPKKMLPFFPCGDRWMESALGSDICEFKC